MRKVGILVMALVLVFGMSFGVIANENEGLLTNDNTVQNSVGVDVHVSKYASLQVPNGNFDINLNNPDSGHTSNDQYPDKLGKQGVSNEKEVVVESNTPVNVNFNWTWSDDAQIADLPSYWEETTGDEWVVSPNIVIVDGQDEFAEIENDEGLYNLSGRSGELTSNSKGIRDFKVFLETNWNDSAQANWSNLEAGEHEGIFTVTISSVN